MEKHTRFFVAKWLVTLIFAYFLKIIFDGFGAVIGFVTGAKGGIAKEASTAKSCVNDYMHDMIFNKKDE